MQTIDLYDELSIEKTKNKNTIEVDCKPLKIPYKNNLVYKAAEAFLKSAEIRDGVKIVLKKNIPEGAGLGGGSSDAAYVLMGLNYIFNKPLNKSQLFKLASEIGSDVPFFLHGGFALAKGRGEKLVPYGFYPSLWAVLVKPSVHSSTKWAYESFDRKRKNKLTSNIGYNKIIQNIKEGDAKKVSGKLGYNDFEDVISQKFPVIPMIKKELTKAGALAVGMTGSGSTMYGIEFSKEKAMKIYRALKKNPEKFWVCLAKTIPREPALQRKGW